MTAYDLGDVMKRDDTEANAADLRLYQIKEQFSSLVVQLGPSQVSRVLVISD